MHIICILSSLKPDYDCNSSLEALNSNYKNGGITKHVSEPSAVKCVTIKMVIYNLPFPSLLAVLHMLSLQLTSRDCVVYLMLHSHTRVITKG